MEDKEPASLVGKTVQRIHLALTRSSDFVLGIGHTVLEVAFWWRH